DAAERQLVLGCRQGDGDRVGVLDVDVEVDRQPVGGQVLHVRRADRGGRLLDVQGGTAGAEDRDEQDGGGAEERSGHGNQPYNEPYIWVPMIWHSNTCVPFTNPCTLQLIRPCR